jgi:hypothetical protein
MGSIYIAYVPYMHVRRLLETPQHGVSTFPHHLGVRSFKSLLVKIQLYKVVTLLQ